MPIVPRVVIVDDMKTNLKIAQAALKGEGYQFFAFHDPLECLEKIDLIQPHILLLDVEMPGLTGIELFKEIKKKPQFKDVPILFVTTLDQEGKLKELFELGANDIISKPFAPYQLKFRVKNNLNQFFLKQKILFYGKKMKEKSEDTENLVRILCHDLVNPLTVLKYFAKKSNEEAVIGAVDQSFEIIEHIREMLALESGKKEIKLEPIILDDLISQSIKNMEIRFQEKEIQFEQTHFQNAQGVEVLAEKTSLLNQVLNNLLSNSAKFSFKGGKIKIATKIDGDHVCLFIKDEGIGIPREILPNLFSKFVKTSRRGTEKEKGTGFGLPLVKTYMDFFQGDIHVDTKCKDEGHEEGHGTTFILTFNIAKRVDLDDLVDQA